LIVGVDISERDLSDPPTRERAKHKPAALFDDPSLPRNQSLVLVRLSKPVRGGRLLLHGSAMNGWTSVERLSLIDSSGRSHPQRLDSLVLADPDRWREATRFRTSRVTDRDHDETGPDERELVVYENQRVLPRAWVVHSVKALNDADTLAAVQHSQLPDGRPFDPLTMALVEPGETPVNLPTDGRSGPSSARVTTIEDGRIVVEMSSTSNGFLVLGEMFYPGWKARIDNRVTDVRRTDGVLQGVSVPSGEHTVIFELDSLSLTIGVVVSLTAALAALWLLWRG
jgi:hypothetical protein